ncbi:hypothetical protein FNH22_22690 [Fulvivirga sp. M361]|uniref:SRPBCC domain-containing protein n=1 Tax=Fulvivirga sp. M361 TaxID=2594266 RepID=UPI00117AC577|nr:SRPBCC domain-containing protein [Fulvivirga sp. M361]TRX51985.1 hypothetical protein FNH22_22690 [Fulvivirga sp. M361]
MSESMIINEKIAFKSNKKEVWNLLTDPGMTKKYMFGCAVLSDWNLGSSITWKGLTEGGDEIIYVKGRITEIIEGERVSFTMFDPNMGIEDKPENYINLTYTLEDSETGTILQLIQEGFEGVENAEKRYPSEEPIC